MNIFVCADFFPIFSIFSPRRFYPDRDFCFFDGNNHMNAIIFGQLSSEKPNVGKSM